MERRTSRRKSASDAPELETETLDLSPETEEKELRSRKQKPGGRKQPAGSRAAVYAAVLLAAAVLAGVFAIRAGRKAPEPPETEPVTEAVTETQPVPEYEPEECRIPEISMLVNAYFNARLNGDTGRLRELFGRRNTEADPELEEKLACQRTWIKEFKDIRIWIYPGLEGDSRFAVITYTIDMRRTDTDAPGVLYAYFTKDAGGDYIFTENLDKPRKDYIREVLGQEKTAAIVEAQDEALRKALSENSNLALIYTSFLNGEIYRESDLETDREQSVDLYNPEHSYLVGREPEIGIAP